jgi:DNA polymerase III sliding clamp (beta) subunit (PCNA family)
MTTNIKEYLDLIVKGIKTLKVKDDVFMHSVQVESSVMQITNEDEKLSLKEFSYLPDGSYKPSDLIKIQKAVKKKDLSIEVLEGKAVFQIGKTSITLAPELFKHEPNDHGLGKLITINDSNFKEVSQSCLYAIGENESRRNLMGLSIKGDKLTGADAFRIVEYTTHDTGVETIVHKRSVQSLLKLDQVCQYFLNESANTFSATCDLWTYSAKVIEASYPDLSRILNLPEYSVELDKAELLEQVTFLKDWEKDINAVCKLKIYSNCVDDPTLKVQNQSGKVSSDLCLDSANANLDEDISIGLNINFLWEALKNLKGDKVTIRFNNSISPIFFQGDNEDIKTVLMPVKIKW